MNVYMMVGCQVGRSPSTWPPILLSAV